MSKVLLFSLCSRKMVSDCKHSRLFIWLTGKSDLKYHNALGIFVFAFQLRIIYC